MSILVLFTLRYSKISSPWHHDPGLSWLLCIVYDNYRSMTLVDTEAVYEDLSYYVEQLSSTILAYDSSPTFALSLS